MIHDIISIYTIGVGLETWDAYTGNAGVLVTNGTFESNLGVEVEVTVDSQYSDCRFFGNQSTLVRSFSGPHCKNVSASVTIQYIMELFRGSLGWLVGFRILQFQPEFQQMFIKCSSNIANVSYTVL